MHSWSQFAFAVDPSRYSSGGVRVCLGSFLIGAASAAPPRRHAPWASSCAPVCRQSVSAALSASSYRSVGDFLSGCRRPSPAEARPTTNHDSISHMFTRVRFQQSAVHGSPRPGASQSRKKRSSSRVEIVASERPHWTFDMSDVSLLRLGVRFCSFEVPLQK